MDNDNVSSEAVGARRFAVALAGCQARVDTRNAQTYASSIEGVTKNMDASKKVELQQSLVALAFDSSDPPSGFMSSAESTSPMFLSAGDKIKGKTTDEIIRLDYQIQINKLDQEIADDASSVQRNEPERAKYRMVFSASRPSSDQPSPI